MRDTHNDWVLERGSSVILELGIFSWSDSSLTRKSSNVRNLIKGYGGCFTVLLIGVEAQTMSTKCFLGSANGLRSSPRRLIDYKI